MDAERLSEAFQNFMKASENLENYYGQLQEKVRYLTTELEEKNSQLKCAVTEAETSRDYLNAILYSLEEAIVVLDTEDRIKMINKSAERLLELKSGKVMAKEFKSLALSVTQSGPDTLLKVKDRKYNIILSRSAVVDSRGNSIGNVILIKDITKLKELEIQHERNQRLIAMGEMVIKIAQDIRNSLCSIELFSNILEKELEATNHERLARGISVGIGNLNNILTNMLSFVRDHKPVNKHTGLNNIIEESLEMLRPLIEAKNVNVRRPIHDRTIIGDPNLLKQAFMNVIINAVQAVPDGGNIEIEMREDGNFIAADVKDNGAGIRNRDIEKIFDPFFTTKDTGTGLGLTTALKIIQNHGGYINVWSEEGRGSTFSLYFPKSQSVEELNETRPE